MAEKIVIHPLNRGIRPVRLELLAEAGRVIEAKAGTTYYWDFSSTLNAKDPLDALQLTQRSSGLDFVAHAVAAARALEEIAGVGLSDTARLSRNILLALDIVYGHVTHFYQTMLPDYIPYPGTSPFYTTQGDYRIPPGPRDLMIRNMWRSFEIRQLIHAIMAVMGGKAPHLCSVVFGGVTKKINEAEAVKISSMLKEVAQFVAGEYSEDFGRIEGSYGQYFGFGGGAGSLLTVGEFPLKKTTEYMVPAKISVNNMAAALDKKLISMDCTRSWFKVQNGTEGASGEQTTPSPGKAGGYSWVKGAVYKNKTYEVGALARMMLAGRSDVTGLGSRAVSALGRCRARLEESKWLLNESTNWLSQLDPKDKAAAPVNLPEEGEAMGTAEASSGAVIHMVSLKEGKIHGYNVLDSFSWNLCPNTREGQKGPLEQALTGLGAIGPGIPFEILRAARSF